VVLNLLERPVAQVDLPHVATIVFQPAQRSRQSTDFAIGGFDISVLVLADLSAAFVSVDRDILPIHLNLPFGLVVRAPTCSSFPIFPAGRISEAEVLQSPVSSAAFLLILSCAQFASVRFLPSECCR
jgi:hypothetical protein